MWDEEIFTLQWLETQDIYQDLDPLYIEEKRSHKLSLKTNKGKAIVEDQEPVVEVDEERFHDDFQRTKTISHFETILPQGESSRVHGDEEEEDLVDYEPSLVLEATHTEVIPFDHGNEDGTTSSRSAEFIENVAEKIADVDLT